MGWFHASGQLEIINVHWPLITWWSKEGQVDWWFKLQKLYAFKQNTKIKFFAGITVKQRKFIIHPEFLVANHIISDQFIQDFKSNPNKVHDLPSEMKISLLKKLEKSIKIQIQKITRITDNNGETEYHGRTYENIVVALEPGWIRDNFEFREPEFYKLVTTVTCDETKHKLILYLLDDVLYIHQFMCLILWICIIMHLYV